jgi:ABC-type Zn uptake system ZnuABC Zn-binding protein ZnuA
MVAVRRRFALLLIVGAVSVLGSGCGPQTAGRRAGFRVVATHSVLGDLVKNVVGADVDVVTLVGPDGDAHTFEPTPADGVALADADVLFENGAGFETWLDKLYASSGSKARRVTVTEGLKLREEEDDQDHARGGQPAAHEQDPHVWHDVRNAVHMEQVVRDRLVQVDPDHADKYRANAAASVGRLQALDRWVADTVGALPPARRKLVTSHDTFGYFADRYGFKIVGTALTSFSTEAADPSAAEFARLVESIKAAGVPAIFAENVHNPKLMERLAREAGVALAPPLYTDALGKPGSAGDTYEKMMRHNVTTIVDALKQ